MKTPFYHNTTRKIIISFATLFNELQIDREDSTGVFHTKPIPIQYATKEKFVARINNITDINDDKIKIEETLPRMGFELTGLNYDPARKTNTLTKMVSVNRENFVFNRVPYNFDFNLYIATRKIDDSLRIVEQILPYFTPEITLRIKDIEALNVETNIPVVLNSPDLTVAWDGGFTDRRTVLWQLQFTVKGYLYAAVRPTSLIKKATIDFKNIDTSTIFESYMAEVDPLTANVTDNYTINETIINNDE